MKPNSNDARLFAVDHPLQSFQWAILVNRFQVDYFILILPSLLLKPHMIWFIIATGIVAALYIFGIGRYLDAANRTSIKNQLLMLCENIWFRLLMIFACALIAFKLLIIIRGYVELVHQFLFPSVDTKLFIILMLAGSYYLARSGLSAVVRFTIIAFVAILCILIMNVHFYFPAYANYYHLLPLLPIDGDAYSIKSFFILWSLYGGPEYLIALTIWAGKKRVTPYLLAGHAMTILEYLFIFIAALLFFGSTYLQTLQFPVIELLRYIQLPFFERVEMFIISIYMTSHLLISSILCLYLYGAARIVLKRMNKSTTRRGLLAVFSIVGLYLFAFDSWFLSTEVQREAWEQIQLAISGCSFLLIPLLFVILVRIRKKVA